MLETSYENLCWIWFDLKMNEEGVQGYKIVIYRKNKKQYKVFSVKVRENVFKERECPQKQMEIAFQKLRLGLSFW